MVTHNDYYQRVTHSNCVYNSPAAVAANTAIVAAVTATTAATAIAANILLS